MAIKKYNPITNGRGHMNSIDFRTTLVTPIKPEKSLLKLLPKKSGRNNTGSITVRHKGGRVKRKYRIIDFKRNLDNILAKVKTNENETKRRGKDYL